MGTVVALSGQVGGAKLADGLRRLRGKDLAVIVNTGDDHEAFGLAFSPDIDTMLYTLSGMASPAAGWEPAGETYVLHEMLQRLGSEYRVRVGDRSFALPLLRTEGLREDCSLAQITLGFCKTLGIDARVLPMSNDPVRTVVVTADGQVSYQEYLTELECEPVVKDFMSAPTWRAFRTKSSKRCMRPIWKRSYSVPPTPTIRSSPYSRCRACASCCASTARPWLR